MIAPDHGTLQELAQWWRGVASDERQGAALYRLQSCLVLAKRADTRAEVWDRCAQQLELVLAGKPFNPDL